MKRTDTFRITQTDKDGGGHEPKKYPNFNGICENRHSTDCIFFILIIAMWVAMTVVGARATLTGNPYSLLSPRDENGRICGYDDGVRHQSRFYSVLTYGVGVCVESCPSVTANFTSTDPNNYICLNSVPTDPVFKELYIEDVCTKNGRFEPGLSTCACNIKAESTSIFHRCVFKNKEFRNNFSNQGTKNYYITGFMHDIMSAKEIIFGFGFGVALVLSFLYTYLMRGYILPHILVWVSLLSMQALLVILVILAYT
eukprot:gene2811-5529_t